MSLSPEVRRGGGLPFGQVVSQWVCDPRYSTNLRTLYTILVTYADIGVRDTARGKPYRQELAAQLGVSLKTLDRTLLEGECAGLLAIERRTDPNNPKLNEASIYHLHDAQFWRGEWTDPLPSGQSAAEAAAAVVAARVEAKRKAGIKPKGGRRKAAPGVPAEGVASPVTLPRDAFQPLRGGVTRDATPGVAHDARVASPMTPNVYNPVLIPDREPSLSSPSPGATFPAAAVVTREREASAAARTDAATADGPAGAGAPEQRELSEQDAAGGRIVEAYARALGRPVLNGTRAKLQGQAAELLAAGFPEAWLADRARELATRGWSDLLLHAERSTVPLPGCAPSRAAGLKDGTQNGLPPWCGQCGDSNPAAAHNARFRTDTGLPDGAACSLCHPSRVPGRWATAPRSV